MQANKNNAQRAKNGQQGEVSTLQQRKQQQMDEVAAAKAAREALIKAEHDERQRVEDAKLLKMKQEQEEVLAKQKKDDARAMKQQP